MILSCTELNTKPFYYNFQKISFIGLVGKQNTIVHYFVTISTTPLQLQQ